MSASSVIAVSMPEAHSTDSARLSRATMLSLSGPPSKVSSPPPPNRPSLPLPPLKKTGNLTEAATEATSSPPPRLSSTPDDARLRAVDGTGRPTITVHRMPPPRSAPPKRVKRIDVPVSKPAMLSAPRRR